MSLELVVELLALGIAVWAAVLSRPTPPSFDSARLFRVALATTLRGMVEAEDGDEAAWKAAVHGALPWAGEGSDPRAALFFDPAELGEDYDPAPRLSPDLSWDEVAAWAPGVAEALARRHGHVVVLCCGFPHGEALAAAAPGVRVVQRPGLFDAPEAAATKVGEVLPAASDRLVLLVAGGATLPALRLLHDEPGLRDRLVGFACLGAVLDGEGARAWLTKAYTQEAMDTELNRSIPFASLRTAAGAAGDAQVLPALEETAAGRRAVWSEDLGLVDPAATPAEAWARAIWLWLAFRL